MKKLFLPLIIVLFSLNFGYSQEKQNKIFFVEYLQGVSIYKSESLQSSGLEVNYQFNKDLLSIRFINIDVEFKEGGSIGFGQPIFSEKTNEKLDELSLLYGKRLISKGHSYSVSVGVSYNFYKTDFTQVVDGTITETTNDSKNYFGLPFELNIKWFKKEKKSPSFGHKISIGLKLFGNISEKSYFGAGIVFGIGNHKNYQN